MSTDALPAIAAAVKGGEIRPAALRFLWLEITPRCNLTCGHCYTRSSPHRSEPEIVDWLRVLKEGFELGCRQVQFIGGEPTLHPRINEYLRAASELGYEFIEIYTNLVKISDDLLQCIEALDVKVATSFYARIVETHERITSVKGSFDRTVGGIEKIMQRKIPLRVGITSMPENENEVDAAISFLKAKGVEGKNIRVDDMRPVGRADNRVDSEKPRDTHCGQCWNGKLAVSWDGVCYPCVFSRNVAAGNVTTQPLRDIVYSRSLKTFREKNFYDAMTKNDSLPAAVDFLSAATKILAGQVSSK